MVPKRKIGLSVLIALGFIVYIYIIENSEDSYSYDHSQTYIYNKSTIETQKVYSYSSYQKEHIVSDKEKDEIFKTTIKGYRKSSYWGNEHSINEKTRDMTQNELNDYLNENYISKNNDLYWGGEY